MMNILNNLNLKTKFTLLLIIIGLLPGIIVSIISTSNSSADVTSKVYNQLTAINQIKKKSIETYFQEREGDMGVLVNIADTLRAQAFLKLSAVNDIKKSQLNDYLSNNNAQLNLLASRKYVHSALRELKGSFKKKKLWHNLLDKHDKSFKTLLSSFGWYDFFLLNTKGDIIYSVTRESDLGQNLAKDLQESSFYQAFELAKSSDNDDIHFADFLPYAPSNNDPAAFAVKAITTNGTRLGYIAFQQPLEKINGILSNRTGMGDTGESYLVGQDMLMRSDSYLNPTDYAVIASFANNNKVITTASKSALNGKKDTAVILDYNNNPVVSSWDFINVSGDVRWAIISEIDVAEAFNSKMANGDEFYKSYIEKYGYYDLFLISPDGFIFYTVTKEADFKTNILNGKYASSNLGELINNISQTKAYGMVDFAPYAPSNDDPAAFIAQPLLSSDGKIALYIALQMPLEGIQTIMSVRDGMGETGESYLVGQDYKMRSNSFLDAKGHSVKASFAGSIKENGVKTKASQQALSGIKGTNIIIDYNNNPVLSSYNHIDFENFKWAVISEIDEPEAFASIRSNTLFMTLLMSIITIIVATIGLFIAKKVTTPIIEVVKAAEHVADGDLTINIKKTSNDEIGQLQEAISKMISNLALMVNNISGVAIQQASTSEELAAITTQTSATVAEQHAVSDQLATAMQEMGATVKEVATNTTNTSTAVEDILIQVNDGSDKLTHTYENILTMTEQIQQSEQSVKKVRADFDQVISILDVIKSIADQTNLLALNAAIEAARAGDQGRGFAVVADEVRQLAQRTQDSTQEIDQMIATITTAANSSVEIMANSVTQASAVQINAKEATELNSVIAKEMKNISDLSTQIATASEQQAVVVDQILQNVDVLNTGVTETSQATDNIAESSVELARLATELEKETAYFKL